MGDCKCDKFCYCPGLTARTLAKWPDSREIPIGSDPLAMTASAGPSSLKEFLKGFTFHFSSPSPEEASNTLPSVLGFFPSGRGYFVQPSAW